MHCRAAVHTPAYDGVDVLKLDKGMFAVMQHEYRSVCKDHKSLLKTYKSFDMHPYHTLRGGKLKGYYRPDKLPRVLPDIADVMDPESNVNIPAQRALTMVNHHTRWLAALKARQVQDEMTPNDKYRNREQVRFIAASQPTAGAMLDISPDGTYLNTFADLDFEVYLQRRGSLNITSAAVVNTAQAAKGETVDLKGDTLSNGGEYNRRHNGVLRRGVAMTTAVAIGHCVQGDKAKPALTSMINATCAVDLAELEGDENTGADVCQEYKVPSPIIQTHRAGQGTRKDGGTDAHVGHRYALGNTEENYRLKVLGCKGRGHVGKDKPFNHHTGKGAIKAQRGSYYDALRNKKATVIPMIVETFGGIS